MKTMSLREMARKGGLARAAALSQARRREIAAMGTPARKAKAQAQTGPQPARNDAQIQA